MAGNRATRTGRLADVLLDVWLWLAYAGSMADDVRPTAVITGGASGIGRALGEALAARGTRVLLADLDGDIAEDVAEGIRDKGGDASAVQLDVSQFAPVAEVIHGAAQRWGRLDYVFNNAGIAVTGEVDEHTTESWNRIIDVNLRGVVHGVQAAYPIMKEQGFGHIVNTASMAGLVAGAMSSGYNTTKHAVVGLTKSLRVEGALYGVRVSVLCPGAIRTPILGGGRHGFLVPGIDRERQSNLMRSAFEPMRPMDPKRFAEGVLKRLDRNQAVIILPTWWRLVWWLERLLPSFVLWMSERGFVAGREKFGELRAEARREGEAAD